MQLDLGLEALNNNELTLVKYCDKYLGYISKIRDLSDELYETEALYPLEETVDTPKRETDAEYITHITSEGRQMYLMMIGTILVGYINVNSKFYKNTAFISGVVVGKEHRRKGYAKTALVTLIKQLKPKYKNTALGVVLANKGAVKLYESLGFKPVFQQMVKSL